MTTSAGYNLQIHLSRNDGQASNTLLQVISKVAGVDFKIRSATLHELGGRVPFVALLVQFKGRSVDEERAMDTLLADLGQPPFSII